MRAIFTPSPQHEAFLSIWFGPFCGSSLIHMAAVAPFLLQIALQLGINMALRLCGQVGAVLTVWGNRTDETRHPHLFSEFSASLKMNKIYIDIFSLLVEPYRLNAWVALVSRSGLVWRWPFQTVFLPVTAGYGHLAASISLQAEGRHGSLCYLMVAHAALQRSRQWKYIYIFFAIAFFSKPPCAQHRTE